jgi:hypothetical protein
MKNDDLHLHELNVDEQGINMKLSGDPAKFFMKTLVEFFEQNGGKNFLTLTVENQDKKYGITIQNCHGEESPAEKLQGLSEEVQSLKNELAQYKGDN